MNDIGFDLHVLGMNCDPTWSEWHMLWSSCSRYELWADMKWMCSDYVDLTCLNHTLSKMILKFNAKSHIILTYIVFMLWTFGTTEMIELW